MLRWWQRLSHLCMMPRREYKEHWFNQNYTKVLVAGLRAKIRPGRIMLASKRRWATTTQYHCVSEGFLKACGIFHIVNPYAGFKTLTLRIGIVIFAC